MKLNRLTERVWLSPFEEARDRPGLGYIRGDRWSLAVDAGHSDDHVADFYRAIVDEGLPLPDLTALTHWHWDHTFGMHAVHGRCVANARTNAYLLHCIDRLAQEGPEAFLSIDGSVRLEYAGGRKMVIVPADVVFSGELTLNLGGCEVRLFEAASPHTDDATLVHVPGEGVLFLGDAAAGVFPTWEKDPVLAGKLADAVQATGAEICLESHWAPQTMAELLGGLR